MVVRRASTSSPSALTCDAVKAKAVSCGADKCIDSCDAAYETKYLLGTSVARPCIAKEMVRIAKAEEAGFVVDGPRGRATTRSGSRCAARPSTPG